jgi:hypothetical protein
MADRAFGQSGQHLQQFGQPRVAVLLKELCDDLSFNSSSPLDKNYAAELGAIRL